MHNLKKNSPRPEFYWDFLLVALSLTSFLMAASWMIAKGSFVYNGVRGFTLFDDAMISMRYGYNFAHSGIIEWSKATGRVEGLTNIGWMLLMAVFIKISSISLAPLLVSVFSSVILLAGIIYLGRKSSKYSSLSPGLRFSALAGSFSLVAWSVRGFETSAIFFLLCLIYVDSTRSKDHLSISDTIRLCLAVSIGIFIRDDFAICIFIYSILLLVAQKVVPDWTISSFKAYQSLVSAAVIAFSLKIIFRLGYFYEFLPNTYYLKVHGHDKIVVLSRGFAAFFGNTLSVFAPLLLVVSILYLVSKKGWKSAYIKPREIDSHLLILTFCSYSILVGGDAWEQSRLLNRFTCVILPFVLLNFLQYIKHFEERCDCRFPLSAGKCLIVIPAYIILLPVLRFLGEIYGQFSRSLVRVDGLDQFNHTSAREDWLLVGAALFVLPLLIRFTFRWRVLSNHLSGRVLTLSVACLILIESGLTVITAEIRDTGSFMHIQDDAKQAILSLESKSTIPSDSKVVSMWAGTFPYFRPDVNFIDPLGKMDKHIARLKPRHKFYPGHTKWNWSYTLGHYKPDFVLGSLEYFDRAGLWTDRTKSWDSYYQVSENLIARRVK